MKTAAIIIAAFDCPEYIMDCVRSVSKQNLVNGWNIDLRVGVDGCEMTSNVLSHQKWPHYFSHENHGAYLIRNSLIYIHPADAYVYFDADDVMMPGYLRATLAALDAGHHVVMAAKINTNEKLNPMPGAKVENGGAITFTHEALESVGGFYRHRVAGDTDLMRRLEMAGYSIHEINEPLYYRRRHNKALTRRADTGMGSAYRKKAWAEMTANREKGIIKIVPTLVPLEKRGF